VSRMSIRDGDRVFQCVEEKCHFEKSRFLKISPRDRSQRNSGIIDRADCIIRD